MPASSCNPPPDRLYPVSPAETLEPPFWLRLLLLLWELRVSPLLMKMLARRKEVCLILIWLQAAGLPYCLAAHLHP